MALEFSGIENIGEFYSGHYLSAVLEAAGSGIGRVLHTSIYLTDLSLFPRVNAVYEQCFTGDPKPARSTIGVASLPLGVQIEVDAIAVIDTGQ